MKQFLCESIHNATFHFTQGMWPQPVFHFLHLCCFLSKTGKWPTVAASALFASGLRFIITGPPLLGLPPKTGWHFFWCNRESAILAWNSSNVNNFESCVIPFWVQCVLYKTQQFCDCNFNIVINNIGIPFSGSWLNTI